MFFDARPEKDDEAIAAIKGINNVFLGFDDILVMALSCFQRSSFGTVSVPIAVAALNFPGSATWPVGPLPSYRT